MIHLFKPVMQHPSTGFFATNAACAIHNNVFIFFCLQQIYSHRQLFSKRIRRYFYSIFKMTYFILVMVTPHWRRYASKPCVLAYLCQRSKIYNGACTIIFNPSPPPIPTTSYHPIHNPKIHQQKSHQKKTQPYSFFYTLAP